MSVKNFPLIKMVALIALLLLLIFCGFVYQRKIMGIGVSASEVGISAPLYRQVNPFQGTGGWPLSSGMTFPGPTRPFGMIRPGPDTAFGTSTNWSTIFDNMATSGYYYGHGRLKGFSQYRLSGTGLQEGGQLRILPILGIRHSVDFSQAQPALDQGYVFSHSSEKAWAGYYEVTLKEPQVKVRLTSTERVAIYQFNWSEQLNQSPGLWISGASIFGLQQNLKETEMILGKNRDSFSAKVLQTGGFSSHYGGQIFYFYVEFDQKAVPILAEKAQLVLSFERKKVEMRVGMSLTSIDAARKHVRLEAGSLSFDELLDQSQQEWEKRLNKIEIQTNDSVQKQLFYTQLYHSMIHPTLWSDADGTYIGVDGVKHKQGIRYRTDLSLWDTVRTLHPLHALIAKDIQFESLSSLWNMQQKLGFLPRWPQGSGVTGIMIGDPAALLLSENAMKGMSPVPIPELLARFDYLSQGESWVCGRLQWCDGHGVQSVSKTLDYSWAGYSMARLAETVDSPYQTTFDRIAAKGKELWNPQSGYFQPRDRSGQWLPFDKGANPLNDELFGTRNGRHWTEGSPDHWRYSYWWDPKSIKALWESNTGNIGSLEQALDAFMGHRGKLHGNLGQFWPPSSYWHGNEHDIHSPWLFSMLGKPQVTGHWVQQILRERYATGPAGLDGNDDTGTLGAWYVWGTAGIYPIAGTDLYWLGWPAVDRMELNLGGDHKLVIVRDEPLPAKGKRVKIYWQGQPLCAAMIRHRQLVAGGTLLFKSINIEKGDNLECSFR